MRTPLVSIVLLSYNRPVLLRRTITSVLSQSYRNIEVIIVDNPSPRTAEIVSLVNEYPACRLYSPETNIGFTGGMNLGLSLCAGEYILLTEDDISLAEDCVERWLQASQCNPERLFSGLILEAETDETNFCGAEISGSKTLMLHLWKTPQSSALYQTDFLSGALIFAAAPVWRRLKGFHADFFMYMEDLELCIRAKREGYSLFVDPGAISRHWGGKPSSSRRDVKVHKLKNLLYVHILHVGRWGTTLLLARFIMGLRHGNTEHFLCFLQAVSWHIRRVTRT